MRRTAIAVLGLLFGCAAESPPEFALVRADHRPSEAYLFDRHGDLLHVSRVDFERRRLAWTPLEEISPALVTATIAAEDRRFFEHRGIDWRALAAASFAYVTGGRRRGASTITMQVAARIDPGGSTRGGVRSVRQKLRQLRAAAALETRWSKAEILEAYFNGIDFRGELAGIAAASQGLFGKAASGLDEAEASILAALLPAPNAAPDAVVRRACGVAQRAGFSVPCGDIEAVFDDRAAQAGLRIDAPWAPHVARRLLRAPGDRVDSTLDLRVQRLVLETLNSQLAALQAHSVRDGAAIVVDNVSGDVLAWVGSAGTASRSRDVDGVRAARQAGSTLKPFLYALALERRYLTAASILDDSPIELETASGLYIPQNYDRAFKGPVSVRSALAGSLNVPAVRTLVLVGVEPFRDRLRALGFQGLVESGEFYGYSLALGSAEVSLEEQVNAYRALANGGVLSPLRLRLDESVGSARRVVDAGAAFIVADILSDRAGRAPAFGLDNSLTTRFWSAVKTGTSKDMRDNWCVGFSRRFTVAVWVGNFEGDSMDDVSGVSGAAPAWLSIMNALHVDGADPAPEPAPGVIGRHVVFEPAIEPPRQEWFLDGTEIARVRAVDPAHRPRIVSPPDGAIIALDPDIPAANQTLRFATRMPVPDAVFVLDGESLGAAIGVVSWLPRPGRHELRLIADSRVLDRVTFQVRAPAVAGSASAGAAPCCSPEGAKPTGRRF